MKKLITLAFALMLALSLTACGRTGDAVKNDTESMGEKIASDTESIVDKGTDSVKNDAENSMNLMAGITANDATESALRHAGLDKSQVRDIEVDLDRDNGKLIYEVDFNCGNTEYDYDIDAETGKVISADKSKD